VRTCPQTRRPPNVGITVAEPVLRVEQLADIFVARTVEQPPGAVRSAVACWSNLRLAPVESGLLELAMSLPVTDTWRARVELG
jgi:hypothetical protein